MIFIIIAYICLALASLIAVLNGYLSFLRYPLSRRLRGANADYRFMSGICGIGTLMCIVAVCLLASSGSPVSNAIWTWIIILQVVDTGGILWFFGTMTTMGLLHCFRGHREP